jgi:hypothetical protein
VWGVVKRNCIGPGKKDRNLGGGPEVLNTSRERCRDITRPEAHSAARWQIVPADEFESAIECDDPATVTELIDGRR